VSVRRNGVLRLLAFLAPTLFCGCGTMMGNLGGFGIPRGHYMDPTEELRSAWRLARSAGKKSRGPAMETE